MRAESGLRGAAAALTACAALCCIARNAGAEEDDRALEGFVRAAPTVARDEPVDRFEWERRLRPPDRFGPPPLSAGDQSLLAAARGQRWAEALQLLKSGRASANAHDLLGANALVPAARAGQDGLLRELLQRGADIERVGDDGFTALGAAAFEGRPSTVRLLLGAGADPRRFGASGQAALHLAAIAGRLQALQELLHAGVDIELLNRQRESALDAAASASQGAAVDLLLKAGADPLFAGRR